MNAIKNAVKVASITGVALTALTIAPAMADSPGQIGGGNIYRVKNLTQNVDYTNPASANACDELEYSVRLHNPGFSSVNDVNVKVSLPSTSSTTNTSNLTATYKNGIGNSTSASTTVNLSSAQTISYESGTAQLLDGSGNVVKTLPEGLLAGGVNVGNLNGSQTEYVNFKAKVSCPSTPPVTPPTTPATPTTPAPTTLVNTGAGSVIGIFAAASAAGALLYRVVLSKKLSRQ